MLLENLFLDILKQNNICNKFDINANINVRYGKLTVFFVLYTTYNRYKLIIPIIVAKNPAIFE